MIKIDVFVLPGCPRCSAGLQDLEGLARSFGPESVSWQERNLLENIDYAVQLGILSAPAIAIDGKLVFASLPNPAQMHAVLLKLAKA